MSPAPTCNNCRRSVYYAAAGNRASNRHRPGLETFVNDLEELFMTSIGQFNPLRYVGTTILALVCGLATLGGCATKPAEPTQPKIAPAERVAAMRESVEKSKPGSQVGQVLITFEQYAAVTDINVADVKLGQVVTFVDIDGNPVNAGTVARIVDSNLHVKFDPNGKRPVQKGDLAVILKD
jgi:hypothetical protein